MGKDDGTYCTLIPTPAALTKQLKETRHIGRDVVVIKITVKQKLDFKREHEKKRLEEKSNIKQCYMKGKCNSVMQTEAEGTFWLLQHCGCLLGQH